MLSDVIDASSSQLASTFEAPVERTNASFQKKWLEVAEKNAPVAVAWLAETLPTRMAASRRDAVIQRRPLAAAITLHQVRVAAPPSDVDPRTKALILCNSA